MSDLRTAQQFQKIDRAREELVRTRATDRRRAEKIERFYEEETILALLSDQPEATRSVVQNALAGKSLKDVRLHAQILNAQRALRTIQEYAATNQELEEALLPAIHERLLEGTDPDAGHYRTGLTKPILPGQPPTEAAFIPRALQTTFSWISTASFAEIHAVEQAALITARLLEIQPFAAGNIKTAQLVASAPLLRRGFPPVVFRREDQPVFIRALGLAFMLSMQDLIDLYAQTLQRLLDEAALKR